MKPSLSLNKKLVMLLLSAGLTFAKAQCLSFHDDFEQGTLSPVWNTGSGYFMNVTTNFPAEGNFALSLTGTSSFYAGPSVFFSPSQPSYITWRVRSSSNVLGYSYMIIGDGGTINNNGIVFSYLTGTDIIFYNTASYNYPITMNNWYKIELVNINWINKSFDIYINGTLFQSNFAFRSMTSTDVSELYLHNYAQATAYYDKIMIGSLPPTVTIAASHTAVCAGASVVLSATGNAVSYAWSHGVVNGVGFTPASTTVYSVVATGTNGCQQTSTVSVIVHPLPVVSISSPTTGVCQGSPITLTANGAFSYTWSTNAFAPAITVTPNVATTYSVIGTNSAGCSGPGSMAAVTITVSSLPVVSASSDKSVSCMGEPVLLTAQGAVNYMWNTNDVTPSFIVSPTTSTTYSVIGTDQRGCKAAATVTQFVVDCTALEEQQHDLMTLSVYPNPSSGEFRITSNRNIQLNLINALGQLVTSISLNGHNQGSTKVNNLSPGIYFLTYSQGNKTFSEKIVITE